MLCEIYASTEHATDVGMSFIKALLYDGVDERRAMKQHPFACLVVILLSHLLPAMGVPFPQFPVLYLLNLIKILSEISSQNVCLKFISYPNDVVS